ncbi:MAG: NUDIX domain-containing protein [Oscillospiraceae bacterium]|nr:NUDIX domain-containing protein [Oscillospiraceae bacterium]
MDRTAARGILVKDGKIALMRVGKLDCHKLPGGGAEGQETPEETFVRELMEETGYRARITHDLGVVDEHKAKTGFCQRSFCFAGEAEAYAGSALTQNERDLGYGLEWMAASEALALFEDDAQTFEEYTIRFMFAREAAIVREWIRVCGG